jgi:hypothetical protein
MNSISKVTAVFVLALLVLACNNKPKPAVEKDTSISKVSLQTNTNEEVIEGLYGTQPESDNNDECKISITITKTKTGYSYALKTKLRQLKGIANLTTNESGEKIIVLEGIEWDEYEGDIGREENNDSIADSEATSQQLDIPIGIGASYTKDTLTIQNYGNAMNSYTKLSECGRKYIQLIKK